MSIEKLKFDKKNFNKHTEFGMSLLEKSLRQNGAGRSILVDKDDNIIAGNGIVEAAVNAGITKTKVVEVTGDELVVVKRTDLELDSKRGREMALADNATAAVDLAWDFDAIAEVETEFDIDASDWGVVLDDEEENVRSVEDDDFNADSETIETQCQRGEIWQLGSHRLMCGDSTNAEDVARLMGESRAELVFTDPPYGMNLDTDYSKMSGDEGSGTKYDAGHVDDFHPEMIKAVLDLGAKETFMWGADYYADLLPNRNDGSWIVWDKRENEETGANVDNRFGSMFELCWSRTKHKREIFRFMWAGMMKQKDVDNLRVHPTQKPVRLAGRFLTQFGKEGDIVVDLFGGSGSTMIACEQLGRKCRMMELDPHYCDVIIARWEKLTGLKAQRLNNG